MKTYGGSAVVAPSFLNSALGGGGWQLYGPAALPLLEEHPIPIGQEAG
jgi:hypothetical protein